MPAKKKYLLPFAEARELVRDECIPSISVYKKWWKANKPSIIPKFPHRVYPKEFTTWNDWLGNNNPGVFGKRIHWRPYHEAVMFVHSLGLKGQVEWYEFCKAGKRPEDIPSRPDFYYPNNWICWRHWTGNALAPRLVAQKAAIAESATFYCIHIDGSPPNVFRFGIVIGGASQLADMKKKRPFQIIKMFKYEDGFNWRALVEAHGSLWGDSEAGDEYICRNVNQLLFDVDLDWVK